MQLMRFLKIFSSPLFSVLIFTGIFSLFRVFEIFCHRKHLFQEPLNVLSNLSYSFFPDFLFFILWNGIYFVFHFIAELNSLDCSYKKRKILFCVLNIPLLILFFMDMQAIAVSGQLINHAVFSAFKIEIILKSWILMQDYWYFILVFILGVFPILKWCPLKITYEQLKEPKYKWMSFLYLFLLLLYSFMTLSYNINRQNNASYQETFYNGMSSRLFSKRQRKEHFFSKDTLEEIIHSIKHPLIKRKKNPLNVVLIIIESFSPNYLTKKQAPFLYKLSEEGLSLKNHVTSGGSTMFSVRSILNGLSTSLIIYKLPQKKTNPIPFIRSVPLHIFKEAGYDTFFFWGDKKDILGFNTMRKNLGITHYITSEDYLRDTNRREDVGAWGDIYEKPFMKFTGQKLKKANSPFLAVILTNEPHYPFDCPGQKNTRSEKQKISHCVSYMDQALEGFFQEVKKAPWFEKTLFVVTGDHPNSMDSRENMSTHFGRHNVPLIFWSPKEHLKKYQSDQISSHTDILPSILDYLGLFFREDLIFINNFVFRPNKTRRWVYFVHKLQLWFLRERNYLLEYNIAKDQSRLWKVDGFSSEELKSMDKKRPRPMQMPKELLIVNEPLLKKYKQIIKAYIQYYYYGL